MKKILSSLILLTLILTIGGTAMAFELKSIAFTNENAIPSKYTCDGSDVSPPLMWTDPPAGTKSFALIADDPDAPMGTWVHWVAWNIPATATSLKEGIPKNPKLADGMMQGISDFKKPGYGGPCPPSGTHRYYFKLYALKAMLDLPENTTKSKLEAAMEGNVVGETMLMGTYSKKK